MKIYQKTIILLIFLATQTQTEEGIYFNEGVQKYFSSMRCFYQSGYKSISWQTVSTIHGIDKNKILTIYNNIRNAGLRAQMIFMPCYSRGPEVQVKDFTSKIPRNLYDTVWLTPRTWDVTDKCGIQGSPDQVCNLMLNFLKEFKKNGVRTGIFAAKQDMEQYFNSCTLLSKFELFWVPDIEDGKTPSFDTFKPFAGWTRPAKKIYTNQGYVCGINLCLTYEP